MFSWLVGVVHFSTEYLRMIGMGGSMVVNLFEVILG